MTLRPLLAAVLVAVLSSPVAAQAPANRPPRLRVDKRIEVSVGYEVDFSSFDASDDDGDLLTFGAPNRNSWSAT